MSAGGCDSPWAGTSYSVRPGAVHVKFSLRMFLEPYFAIFAASSFATNCLKSSRWRTGAKSLLLFSNRALGWYDKGDGARKREIARIVGSNLTLTGKILSGTGTEPIVQLLPPLLEV